MSAFGQTTSPQNLLTGHGSWLGYARALRALGLSIIPVPRGAKAPVLKWKQYQDRFATDDELQAWFDGEARPNIAIVTGAISGIIVVDLDSEAARHYAVAHLPITPWWVQTARGLHLYFGHPGFRVAGNGNDLLTTAGPLPINIRGDGSLVMAPGSVHTSGAYYRAAWKAPKTELPRYWPAWLAAVKPPPKVVPHYQERAEGVRGSEFQLARARAYLASMPLPVIGHGSDQATFSAACRLLRGFDLPAADTQMLLWDWCGHRDGWTYDWVARKVTSAQKHGTEPTRGLLDAKGGRR